MPSAFVHAPEYDSVQKEELESLPMELLTKVLKELECTDVLRVRQTSRRLHEASKSLDLWLHLYRVYAAASPSISHRLKAPVDTFSQDELEKWLLGVISLISDAKAVARARGPLLSGCCFANSWHYKSSSNSCLGPLL
ncbi:hypothetical protein K443DRAFT_362209 [Laccaria amethystina LaAM-08-1]|uniref:F-box domain-containing protein n=1 Tax=Laccaria amethystina LaAM-08-1 TaxID=1095629 RepID=A0A0C9X9R3_9AGAR|nr:hypothetical protein K443DRAFT_362209 [Laccaria amethystina LaAM-08-1]